MNFSHGSAVIVIKNKWELAYTLSWCDFKNKKIPNFLENIDKLPIALSVNSSIVGHTYEFDRALYYITFNDFISQLDLED